MTKEDVIQRVFYELNSLNATARTTDSKYAQSPLCECITSIVKDAAEVIHKRERKRRKTNPEGAA